MTTESKRDHVRAMFADLVNGLSDEEVDSIFRNRDYVTVFLQRYIYIHTRLEGP